jgi:hypothetical protein
MKLVPTLAAAVVLATALTGCSSKNKPSTDPSPHHAQVSPSAITPSSSSPSSPSSSPHKLPKVSLSAVGATNTIDPCQLVTQDEAKTMTNASFGPGKEGGNRIRRQCVYGAQTPNVLIVFVVQAASSDDAQAGWDQLLAQAQGAAGQAANLVHLTPGTGIGDRSEWLDLNLPQIGVYGRGLAFLKGSVGVYMIDEVRGSAAPTQDAMTTQAQTVLSRLP